ncbi:MAG: protein-disulfide isomerase DsbG-like protein [Acidobacteria bacterium]|nr:protein-disulfide isomerase DsbG-like protein [Acidobacteriota bacterium]
MFTFHRICRAAVSLALLMALLPGLARSQNPPKPTDEQQEIRREIRELRQGQEAIQKELQEIKRILLAKEGADPARPPRPENISIGGRPFRGNQNARVVLIEFSDYQCPFCGRFYRDTLPQVDKDYIGAGKIKYVFNNLPLEELHSSAFRAAQAVECAFDQGKFWELHNRLFANQNALATSDLATQAKAAGLDVAQFSQCLDSGKTSAAVRAGIGVAESIGIQATPTFVVGLVDPKNPDTNNIKILSMIGGAHPYPVFKAALEKALAAQAQ